MSTESKARIVPLRGDTPVPGQKFACMSFIGPDSRNKHNSRGFKVRQAFETEEEAREMAQYYRDNDEAFDVFVIKTGEWIPFPTEEITDSIQNQQYAQSALNDIVTDHLAEKNKADIIWQKELEENKRKIREDGTKESQEKRLNEKESARSIYYKIKQLQLVISQRKDELEVMENKFTSLFESEERNVAMELEYPKIEVQPLKFDVLS